MPRKKTRIIRIDNELKKELELKLPFEKWPNRIRTLYDTSLVKQQENIESFGRFIYGKKVWSKFFGKK